MFYSDLKHVYIIRIISTIGSHSLIIDLSIVVCFFHKIYCHLAKISEIETAVIRPNHRSVDPSKTDKN